MLHSATINRHRFSKTLFGFVLAKISLVFIIRNFEPELFTRVLNPINGCCWRCSYRFVVTMLGIVSSLPNQY